MKPKIFIWSVPLYCDRDLVGYALSEDGVLLGSHCSSNEGWFKIDMMNDYKIKIYEDHYPDGYQIEWVSVEDSELREDFKEALSKLP